MSERNGLGSALRRFVGIELSRWIVDGGVDRTRRARLLLALNAMMLPLGIALAVLCFVMASPFVGGAILTVCVLGGFVPWVMHRFESVTIAGHYLCLILYVVTVTVTATTGGPHGEAIYFFILPPVLSIVLSGRRAGLVFTVASIVGVVAFEIIELMGLTPTNLIPDDQFVVDLVGRVTLIAVIVATGLMYEAFKEFALGELGRLNEELSGEVERHERTQADLERTHQALVDAARQAGMAQVATGVLHNVGNALNSVSVSAACLSESVDRAHVDRLHRLAARLEASDLPPDKVAEFLRKLGDAFGEKIERVRREAHVICEGVEHIGNIVSRQQSLASNEVLAVTFGLDKAVAEAVRFARAKLSTADVVIETSVDAMGPVTSDRHRVLEILINLIVNAAESARQFADDPKVRVVAERAADGWVRIQVEDNGQGISADHLAKLFAFGFTTKSDGHGFGLHTSANAATESGGRLRARSDGLGCGATFTLEIPVQASVAKAS